MKFLTQIPPISLTIPPEGIGYSYSSAHYRNNNARCIATDHRTKRREIQMSFSAVAGPTDESIYAEVKKSANGVCHRIIGRYASPDGRQTIHHVRFLGAAEVTAVVVNGRYVHQFIGVSPPVYSPDSRHVAYVCESMPDPDMDDGDSKLPACWVFVDGHHVYSDAKVSNLAFTDDGAFVTFTTDGAFVRIPTPETPSHLFEAL